MARLPRFVIPGHPQHVIVRGNNRQEIFCAEADFRFLSKESDPADRGTPQIALVRRYNHGYTFLMKTAISIPDPVFKAAETLANRLGVSRSELYAKAVEAFVKEHRHQGVTDKLNEIYGLESGLLEEGFSELQQRSIEQENW